MNWTDEGLILGGRRFGEGGLIIDVLTKTRGRRSGLVYGGASRARRAQYEAGNTVSLSWTGSAVTTLLRGALDEGDAAGSALYEATTILLDQIEAREVWPALYVRWELGLLSALGFGLDLDECALSGANDGLTHVSPKTGRAVRGSEAEEYVNRLLRLPGFLVTPGAPVGVDDIADGLALTGYFIEARVFNGMNRAVPAQRAQLVARLLKRG